MCHHVPPFFSLHPKTDPKHITTPINRSTYPNRSSFSCATTYHHSPSTRMIRLPFVEAIEKNNAASRVEQAPPEVSGLGACRQGETRGNPWAVPKADLGRFWYIVFALQLRWPNWQRKGQGVLSGRLKGSTVPFFFSSTGARTSVFHPTKFLVTRSARRRPSIRALNVELPPLKALKSSKITGVFGQAVWNIRNRQKTNLPPHDSMT